MENKLKYRWVAWLVLGICVAGCSTDRAPVESVAGPLNVDTLSATGEWNTVWKSDILSPGKYYEVEIPYRIFELGDDAYLYSVVVPDHDSDHTLASVRWRSGHLDTQRFSFYIPGNETNCRVVLGVRNKGRAVLDDVIIRELPLIDPGATEYVESPGYEPYGVCTHFIRWSIWGPEAGFTDEQVRESIKQLAEAGVQWIRVDAQWVIVEEKEGIYDERLLRRIDRIIEWAHQGGIQVYLQLGGQPQWASTHPDEPDFWAYGTRRMPEFRDYLNYVTQRYKGRVRYWEVGNEPDWIFWKDPLGEYVDYLKISSEIIRAADAGNQVVLGGLAFDGTHVWSPQKGAEEDALRRMYEMGIQSCFDVLSAHFYPLKAHNSLYEAVAAINQICSVMNEFGDVDKPIWLTESGYSSARDSEKGLEHQSNYLKALYTDIIAHPRIEKIFWYNYRCKHDEGEYENNFGLINNDFSSRPAFQTLEDLGKHRLRPVNNTMLPDHVGR
ncbi:MAG: cellulase family glycosylhydrolase [Verrucomicrobiota bacterium]|nr:cellulase family glycosylhydrolase [Verrucomicrobiota bacterium]